MKVCAYVDVLRGRVSSKLRVAALWPLRDMMAVGLRCIKFCLMMALDLYTENVHVHVHCADGFGCVFIL